MVAQLEPEEVAYVGQLGRMQMPRSRANFTVQRKGRGGKQSWPQSQPASRTLWSKLALWAATKAAPARSEVIRRQTGQKADLVLTSAQRMPWMPVNSKTCDGGRMRSTTRSTIRLTFHPNHGDGTGA
jgi:hypothetical protein